MLIRQIDRSSMSNEYGVSVCRLLDLLPIATVAGFGSSVVEVAPGEAVVQHSHAEHELWILMSGTGEVVVDGRTASVSASTMIYMQPDEPHSIRSQGPTTSLIFLAIWWN